MRQRGSASRTPGKGGSMSQRPTLDSILGQLRAMKPELSERYHVASVALFGSYVQHRESDTSDLDVLISFREAPSLLRFLEIENSLSDRLGVKVDLVMEEALKPNIGRRIRQELIPV
jgi:predicted nucleotidyltransferase